MPLQENDHQRGDHVLYGDLTPEELLPEDQSETEGCSPHEERKHKKKRRYFFACPMALEKAFKFPAETGVSSYQKRDCCAENECND